MTFQPWTSSKAGLQNVFVGSVGIQLCFNVFVLLNVFNFVLFSLDDLLMGGISAHVSFLIILITVLKKLCCRVLLQYFIYTDVKEYNAQDMCM